MTNLMKFYIGNRSEADDYNDGLFFTEDTHEIFFEGYQYGIPTLQLTMFVTDNDGNFTYALDGSSILALYQLIEIYKTKYPSQNEFPLITNVTFQQSGGTSDSATNKIFDKMWYIDYTDRIECTIQRMQLQHTSDANSTLSMFTIKFNLTQTDGGSKQCECTVRENMIRISNDGNGDKFLNDQGVYSYIPQQELPVDFIINGDGSKFLSDDGTYKIITTGDQIYEEINMKAYKIDLTSSDYKSSSTLTNTDAQKIESYITDISGDDPSILFIKRKNTSAYQVYSPVSSTLSLTSGITFSTNSIGDDYSDGNSSQGMYMPVNLKFTKTGDDISFSNDMSTFSPIKEGYYPMVVFGNVINGEASGSTIYLDTASANFVDVYNYSISGSSMSFTNFMFIVKLSTILSDSNAPLMYFIPTNGNRLTSGLASQQKYPIWESVGTYNGEHVTLRLIYEDDDHIKIETVQ